MYLLLRTAIMALSIPALSAVLITCNDVNCPSGECVVEDGVAYCAACDPECTTSCDGVTCPVGAECKRTGSVVHCVGCPGIPPGHCRPTACNATSCGGQECKITGAVAHCNCDSQTGPKCQARCLTGSNAPSAPCSSVDNGGCSRKNEIAFCDGTDPNAALTCDYVECKKGGSDGFCREVGDIVTCNCNECNVKCNSNTCENGGECVELNGNGAICQCPGEAVNDTCKPLCSDVVCPATCGCRITGTVIHCECGSLHGQATFAKCANPTCSNGAYCRETGSVIHCRPDNCIPDAATDYGCEELECAGPCRNGGTYTCGCICPDGYEGRFCHTPSPVLN